MTLGASMSRLHTHLRGLRIPFADSQRVRTTCRILAIALLVVALQSWAFHRHFDTHNRVARQNLQMLRLETMDRRLIDEALGDLREYWRLTEHPAMKSLALELRENVVLRYNAEPLAVIDKVQRGALALEGQTEAASEALARFNSKMELLRDIHADHTEAAWSAYASPPVYLQPTAALIKLWSSASTALNYNRGLYLMLVGEREQAQELYLEMRQAARSPKDRADILFAQGRLRFDSFENTKDPQQLSEALQHVRQSVRSNPQEQLPKMFLDYLLAHEMRATEVDAEPLQGEGSGEGEGQRGAISSRAPEF